MSEGGIYEVEKILNCRIRNGKRQFLVRWKGFDEDEDSWEPEPNLNSCIDILNQFVQAHEKSNPSWSTARTKKVEMAKINKSSGVKTAFNSSSVTEHDRLMDKLVKHRKRFEQLDSDRSTNVRSATTSTSSTFLSSASTMSSGNENARGQAERRLTELQQHANALHRQTELLPPTAASSTESLSDWFVPTRGPTVASASRDRPSHFSTLVREAWFILLVILATSVYIVQVAFREASKEEFVAAAVKAATKK